MSAPSGAARQRTVRSRRRWLVAGAAAAAGCVALVARASGEPAEVTIGIDDDAADVVAAHPPGTHFVFATGEHHLVMIEPRDGDRYRGEPGAVLSGDAPVERWRSDPAGWVAEAPVPRPPAGECQPAFPACALPEELFLDGRPLRRQLAGAALTADAWALDEERGLLVLGADPTGREVTLSRATAAFGGAADDVVIAELAFRRYANQAGVGVLHMADGAERWTIDRVTVTDSHGPGVVLGGGSTVRASVLRDNGQLGLGGTGADIAVVGNVIEANNRAGFSAGWSAGGAKFARTERLEVRDNVVRGNDGPGLWTDIDNLDTRYVDNTIEDNAGAGIRHEISWSARIEGNRLLRNGRGANGWVWGAGIEVMNSSGVVVRGNVVEGNRHGIVGIDQQRGTGALGPWRLAGFVVEDNDIVDSGQTGVVQDHGADEVYSGQRFEANRYRGEVSWTWQDAERDFAAWQGFGFDALGSFEVAR
ncbi:MAG: right-handed parallel beta-helix repeat-containing protein [Acidimicrobiales bacterium]